MDNRALIRSGEALAIGWSRQMLYSGFNTLPRSVIRLANSFDRSDNLDVIRLKEIPVNSLKDSENPYSPPPSAQTDSNTVEFDLYRVIAVPFSILFIVFLVGVPIFVCLSFAWIIIDSTGIVRFNSFVFPSYNPLATCAATTTILILFSVYWLVGDGNSKWR